MHSPQGGCGASFVCLRGWGLPSVAAILGPVNLRPSPLCLLSIGLLVSTLGIVLWERRPLLPAVATQGTLSTMGRAPGEDLPLSWIKSLLLHHNYHAPSCPFCNSLLDLFLKLTLVCCLFPVSALVLVLDTQVEGIVIILKYVLYLLNRHLALNLYQLLF